MEATSICSGCGKPLPANAPQGLCPECLLQAGLGTGVDVGPDTEGQPAGGSKGFVPPSPEELGRFFPQMEIICLLGRGGMGAVYQARQKQLDRIVALKILPPSVRQDPAFAERFTREARALAKLTHPHIVTLYEFGQADGLFYFLMEYVDGVSLRQLLQASRISPREALAIVPQVCEALQYAHDRGIVHRDIKPENILLNREGQVKITDFGVARIVGLDPGSAAVPGSAPEPESSLTEAGRVVGTPQYMAPEQVTRPLEVDHRADIYSLGVVLYQMLTGELPGKPLEPPSRKVQIDVRLDEVVLHALEKEPSRRYQQVSEVKTAVETISTPPAATPELTAAPSASWEAARRRVRALATALMWLGLLGTVLCTVARAINAEPGKVLLDLGLWRQWVPAPPGLSRPWIYQLWFCFPALYLLVALGAARMRRLQDYGLVIAGGVLAMITPPLVPLGLPLGVWALAVLARMDTRREFGVGALAAGPDKGTTGPRLSKLAVAAAAVALVPVLYEALSMVDLVSGGVRLPLPGWRAVVVLAECALWGWTSAGTLVLAWVALEDVRRSRGHLKGSGIALFALLFVFCRWAMHPLRIKMASAPNTTSVESHMFALIADLLGLMVCAALALWVHRRELRQLRSGQTGAPRGWWLFSPQGAWLLRAFACLLIGLSVARTVQPRLTNQREGKESNQRWKTMQALNTHSRVHSQSEWLAQHAPRAFPPPVAAGPYVFEAVSDVSVASPICWRMNGAPLCEPPPEARSANTRAGQPRPLVLSLRVPLPKDDPAGLPFELRIDGKPVAADFTSPDWGAFQFIWFHAPPDAALLNVRVGQPVGSWQDTYVGWEWDGKQPRLADRLLPDRPELFLSLAGQQAQMRLTYLQKLGPRSETGAYWRTRSFPHGWSARLVVVDDSGVVHPPSSERTPLRDATRAGTTDESYAESYQLDLSRIKAVRFQVRRCQWMEVRNISLQPGQHSQVEVVEPARSAAATPANQPRPAQGALPVIEARPARSGGSVPADARETAASLGEATKAMTLFAADLARSRLMEERTKTITQLAADLRVEDALDALRDLDNYPLAPEGAQARLEIAGALRKQGRFAEAVALLEKTAKDDPYNRAAPDSLELLTSILRSDLKDDNRYGQRLLELATKYYPGIPAVARARAAYGQQPPEVPINRKILLDYSVREASIFGRCFMGDSNPGQWDVIRTLSDAGYVVHANEWDYPVELTPKVMRQYGLIIMNLCHSQAGHPISEQLATDLAGYVTNGGSLLVISAGTTSGGGGCARFYNPLMARFGLVFKDDGTTGGSRLQGQLAAHPAVHGLAGFTYECRAPVTGGTVLASDGAEPLIAVTAVGKGKVIAAGIGYAFCGCTMGDIYRFTPEQKAKTLPNKALLTRLVACLLQKDN